MYGHATVDTQNLPGNVACFWHTEEANGSCDFFSGAETTQRGRVESKFALLLCQIGGEFSGDEAWSNRIGRDIADSHLAGSSHGESNETSFGGGIVGLTSGAEQTGDGGNIYDTAPAGAHHAAQRGFGAEEGGAQVTVNDVLEVTDRHLQN